MSFSSRTLLDALKAMPTCHSAIVGFSGGLDSTVLLHALVQLREEQSLPFTLRALHVNHGLHAAADTWENQCARQCEQWGVPFTSKQLHLADTLARKSPDGQLVGVENAARDGRYATFTEVLQAGEALLLAHHRDDQMETLLLRLMRGAGPRGLAGMPCLRTLGQGFLYRPLLGVDRAQLEDYASAEGLTWIDDSSNAQLQFDRNYVRQSLLPLIAARWPGYRDSWGKSITLQAETEVLLGELAALDLQRIQGEQRYELQLGGLTRLSDMRQRNVLRHWLESLSLPAPGWNEMHRLTMSLLPAAQDAQASWSGEGYLIRRYRNRLTVLRAQTPVDPDMALSWNPRSQPVLELPGNGRLAVRAATDATHDRKLAVPGLDALTVRYRQGGEYCRLRGRPGKPLKKLLQEQHIAPWIRERLPLVYAGDELLCVPGIGATEHAGDAPSENGVVIEWQPPEWQPNSAP